MLYYLLTCSGSWLAQNLLTLHNVCIHRNYINVFPPPGGGDFKNFTTNLSKWDSNPQEEGGEERPAGEQREGEVCFTCFTGTNTDAEEAQFPVLSFCMLTYADVC